MNFDYKAYKTFCFAAPAFFVVAVTIVVFLHGAWLIYVAHRGRWDWRKNGLHLLILIGVAFTACIQVGVLLSGGMYLCDEQETDAVEMQGEITNIKGLGQFVFPVVKDGRGYEEENGYEFTIGGVKCAANRKGSLKVGDYVTVRYLPKSGYILYIAEIEEESDNKSDNIE